jgi:hypothetical protein
VNPEMSESKIAATTKKEDLSEKKQGYRPYGRSADDTKKSTDGITMLRYGQGNNFHQFKQASEAALEEYGNLINLGKYYVPEFSQPTPPGMLLSAKQQESMEMAVTHVRSR